MESTKKIKKGQIEDFVSDSTQSALDDKLDKNISTLTAVTLPLLDTDKLIVNRDGVDYSVDKSELGGGTEISAEDIWTYFKGDLFMCQATGTTLNNIGYPGNPTLVGTGANIPANLSSIYSTSPYATWSHRRQISSSVAGNNASATWAWKLISVGTGFYSSVKVNVTQTTNGRMFFGFTDSTSDIGNVNPSTLTNMLGFGSDSGDTNLQIMHNDSTGTATKVDLGSDFLIDKTSNNTYLIEKWNFQNSSNCYFRIKNLLNGITSSILEVTTDLSTETDGLAFHLWANNGTDASSVTLHFSNHSIKKQS